MPNTPTTTPQAATMPNSKEDRAQLLAAFKADLLERTHAPDSIRHLAATTYRQVEAMGDAWKADPTYDLPHLLALAVDITHLAPSLEDHVKRGNDLAMDTQLDATAAGLLVQLASAFVEFAQENAEGFTSEGVQAFVVMSYLRGVAGHPNALTEHGDWVRETLRKGLGKADAVRLAKKYPALADLLTLSDLID